EFTSPWCASAASADAMVDVLSPSVGRIIAFHLLLEGKCQVDLKNVETLELVEGEILILPHGDEHLIWHGSRTNLIDRMMSEVLLNGVQFVQAGGGGEKVRFICGCLACDPHLCDVILAGLPRMIKVNIRSDDGGQWLENSLRHSVCIGPNQAGSSA